MAENTPLTRSNVQPLARNATLVDERTSLPKCVEWKANVSDTKTLSRLSVSDSDRFIRNTVTVDDFSNRAEYVVLDVHCQTNCVLNVDKSAIIVRPTVNSVVLSMELDTGSAISIIPVDVYQSKFANCQLQPSNKVLRSFTSKSVPCKDMFKVNVQYNSHNVDLVLYVVPDSRHVLFGRDWLEAIKLDWTEIKFRSGSGSVCLSHDC